MSTAAPTTTTPPPSPVRVVGLGDSVTAGTACGCTPFVTTYAAMLAQGTGRAATSANLGRAGLTTTGLASQLASPSTRVQLAHASVVVVTIGANDLGPLVSRWSRSGCDATCIADGTAQLGPRLTSTLTLLRDAVPSSAHVLVTTYWNVFEDGDVADREFGPGFAAWSDAVTRAANARIDAAARAVGAHQVDLYTPFEGSGDRNATALLADDGDHPNAAGHRLIAQALLQADDLSTAAP